MNDETTTAIWPEPEAEALMRLGTAPVENPAFPFFVYNPHRLPDLLEAFAAAQGEYLPILRDKLVVQKLKDKDTGNYTGGTITFYYAELASIIAAAIPALSKHGISFSQPLQDTGTNGTWLLTMLAHKSGCVMITKVKLAESKDIKAFGTQITYLRRYMAGPALGVSAEDDAENDGSGAGDGDEAWEARNRAPHPSRPTPARRSAAAPAAEGGINQGELANLQKKITAAKLEPAAVDKLLAELGIPAIGMSMSKEHWAAVKHAVESL
jgi:hypothetical protein